MRSRNPVYPLQKGSLSIHSNGNHKHISRHKSYSCMETELNKRKSFLVGTMPSPNIPDVAKARQDLLHPTAE